MRFRSTFNWSAFSLSVVALVPLLMGTTLHYLLPCSHQLGQAAVGCHSGHDHAPYNSHHNEHSVISDSQSSCLVCKFLAMPRNLAAPACYNYFIDLIQWQEVIVSFSKIVLYLAFKLGRAPPTVI